MMEFDTSTKITSSLCAIKYDINMRFASNKRQPVPVIIISIILNVELFSIEVELNHVSADNNNQNN